MIGPTIYVADTNTGANELMNYISTAIYLPYPEFDEFEGKEEIEKVSEFLWVNDVSAITGTADDIVVQAFDVEFLVSQNYDQDDVIVFNWTVDIPNSLTLSTTDIDSYIGFKKELGGSTDTQKV